MEINGLEIFRGVRLDKLDNSVQNIMIERG